MFNLCGIFVLFSAKLESKKYFAKNKLGRKLSQCPGDVLQLTSSIFGTALEIKKEAVSIAINN